ncbi:hypothetical protein A0H81_01701 [Grifola frondosa]|uniref:Uncharacterized protein n=1 Tax=Grifola frondosa TaxID=5627 RepID=A0A1C7MKY1_GRIFR|nr:hypothetical protein A0H81_01701 [Grifola frondosa]
MHEMFKNLDASSSKSGSKCTPKSFDFGDRSTFVVEPPLELLSRVQAFLPELAASNADLARRAREDPDSIDIENLTDEEKQYIEMDLGLGVFDCQGDPGTSIPSVEADLAAGSSETSSSDTSDSDSDSDSDSTSDSESDSEDLERSDADIIMSSSDTPSSRPVKPLPKRGGARPGIVVLGEGGSASPKAAP